MPIRATLSLIMLLVSAVLSGAAANKLRVEPVMIDLSAPASSATVTLRNEEDQDVTVQTRVMAWRQVNGREIIEPTSDVVASPPQVRIQPGATAVVRIVRVSRSPVAGEESYRLFVDQLPTVRQQQARAVNLLIRHSIPAFFRGRDINRANVSWTYARTREGFTLIATNSGDERLRLSNMTLREPNGRTVSVGAGLVGYSLGRSIMSWAVPRAPAGFGDGGSITIIAQTDKQPINATARPAARP